MLLVLIFLSPRKTPKEGIIYTHMGIVGLSGASHMMAHYHPKKGKIVQGMYKGIPTEEPKRGQKFLARLRLHA